VPFNSSGVRWWMKKGRGQLPWPESVLPSSFSILTLLTWWQEGHVTFIPISFVFRNKLRKKTEWNRLTVVDVKNRQLLKRGGDGMWDSLTYSSLTLSLKLSSSLLCADSISCWWSFRRRSNARLGLLTSVTALYQRFLSRFLRSASSAVLLLAFS